MHADCISDRAAAAATIQTTKRVRDLEGRGSEPSEVTAKESPPSTRPHPAARLPSCVDGFCDFRNRPDPHTEARCEIQEGRTLQKELKNYLGDIKKELELMNEAFKQPLKKANIRRNVVPEELCVQEIQELAYDIEDCLDLHRRSSTLPQLLLRPAKTLENRTRFAEEIKRLKQRAKDANRRRNAYAMGAPPLPPSPSAWCRAVHVPEDDLVGMDKLKKEVLDLLQLQLQQEGKEACNGGEQQLKTPPLKVVCIVGPRGLGKTTLARVVYESLDHDDEFDCRAWVYAPECTDGRGLLPKVLEEVNRPVGTSSKVITGDPEPVNSLRTCLQNKRRYLIVLDDLQLEEWDAVEHACPDDSDIYGRIIVTTSVNSVADVCCSRGGSVYLMQSLSKELSSELFMKKVFGSLMRCPPDMQIWANNIVKKCDGLPLALVSVAQLLRSRSDWLTAKNIEEVCTNLGYYLEMSPALEGMQRALTCTYDSLPGHDLKNCFLSLSIFHEDRLVRRKSLVRRWLAEGLVAKSDPDEEKKADEYFEELINRNVIQPVDSSSRDRVKTCRIHGVMHDFIVHKSVSENFITTVHNDNFRRTKEVARRFSLRNTDAESIRMAMEMDLCHVRSLTIFEQDGKDLGDFERFKLLRALNLEYCKELGNSVLDSICELLHLKYLSLRGTDVSKLPKKMYKLEVLETLDIRRTGVSVVPMGVLTLPRLAHLLGRFHLPSQLGKVGTSKKMQSFFSEKSQLQTLAGFAIDQSPGFEHIMNRMTKLRTVKIWCGAAPGSSLANDTLVSSLAKRFHRNMHLKSLTIDFDDLPLHFLYSLSTPCVCNSIKLRGKLNNNELPDFILSQHKLLELHLLSVDLCSEALVDLAKLNHLKYLKIADDRIDFGDGKFDIRSHGFQSLEHMCIQTPKLPQVSIEVGAMPKLTYLELLCPNVKGLDAKDMNKLENLKEVTLAHSVSTRTKETWDAAAKVHVKRPTIRTSCPEFSH